MIRKLLFCIGLFALVLAGAANAQIPRKSGGGLDENGIPYSNRYWQSQPSNTVISLIRKPELNENQFVLRITNPYTINGCADIGNYAYSAEYKDVYLDISLGSLTVDMRDQPQYAHLHCPRKSKSPVADIIINRTDLAENRTRAIRLHNGTDTNYYNIKINENRVIILPDENEAALVQRFKPQKIAGKKSALTYWFYPLGTVLLWVPGMESSDQETLTKLRSFAQDKNLVPLETVFQDFQSPLTNSRYQYFVDTDGILTDNDPALADGKIIGEISIEKKVYGLEKDEIKLDKVSVYAKTPGMYE